MPTNMESSLDYNNELNSELNDAIFHFNMEEKNLENQIKSNDTFRNTYKKLNFHYDTSLFPINWKNIILKMREYNIEQNSLERALLKNEQVQHLFATIISDHIQSRNERLKRLENVKKENDKINWEEYSNRESTPEKFEEFLLSEEWTQILINEINRHLDENGNTYDSYKITSDVIALKLRTAWFDKMYREYSLEYLEDGIDEKENRLKQSVNIILDNVDSEIWDYLKNWWDKSWKWLLKNINSMFNDENNWFSLEELQGSDFNMDDLRWLLKNKIQRYAGRILKLRKRENIWQYLWNAELDLQLKSYLYIYGKSFYPEEFQKPWWELSDYEWILLEIFEAILKYDGKLETVKSNKFVEREKQAEDAKKERDDKRIERNLERNQHMQSGKKPDMRWDSEQKHSKSIDSNNATWAEIAWEADLNLDGYDLEVKESDETTLKKNDKAFHIAWKKFVNSSEWSEFKWIFTEEDMHLLFDIKTWTFRNRYEDINIQNPLLQKMDEAERKKIYDKLTKFLIYFDKAKDHLFDTFSKIKEMGDKKVKIYAVGTVIDDVKDSFSKIAEKQFWDSQKFKLDTTPISQDWDDIIISGTLNGSKLVLRYNLRSGYLLMNSLFQKIENAEKYKIWNNIWTPIWLIGKFDDILGKYQENFQRVEENTEEDQHMKDINQWSYHEHENHGKGVLHGWTDHPPQKIPTDNRESKEENFKNILNTKINLINEDIENELRNRAIKNVTVTNFMKTFNIIPDSWEKNLIFEKNSTNLFNIIQVINNTGNIGNSDSLKYFNNEFMPKIMQYSWLKWWKNNLNGPEKNTDNQKEYEVTFNNNNKNENISKIRKGAEDFKWKIISKKSYDWNYQLEFVNFIADNFTDWDEPVWKLNLSSMKEFLMSLNKDAIDEEFEGKLKEAYI